MGLRSVERAQDWVRGPRVGVKGNNCPRLLSPTPDPYTLSRPSISLYAIQIISRSPYTPIPTQVHPSEALYTHQGLQYPSPSIHTHLKPFKPILGPPHRPKAPHTHLRPSTPT